MNYCFIIIIVILITFLHSLFCILKIELQYPVWKSFNAQKAKQIYT